MFTVYLLMIFDSINYHLLIIVLAFYFVQNLKLLNMRRSLSLLSILIISAFLFISNPLNGQISVGGIPKSFELKLDDKIEVKEFPKINIKEVQAEDEIRDADGELYRYGVSQKAGFSINSAGTWTQLANGDRIWRLVIHAEEALAIGVYYSDFWIPEGCELYLYGGNKEQVIGAFTYINNHPSGKFANELIYGETVILEYFQPSDVYQEPIIEISEIAYAYRSVYGPGFSRGGTYETSQDCEVDAVCSEGNNWRDQQRGVARISVKHGTGFGWCSGSLVNNTDQDCLPYFLTADHCADGTSFEDLLVWVFYFNYERQNCNDSNEPEPASNTMTGATKKARGGWSGSDFYLVLFNSYIPIEYDVFFNGWRTINASSTSGVGIHHPAGDVKKISTYTNALVNSSGNTHWAVKWTSTANGAGVTEGGSSGSPIFNNNGLVVGTLTGGLSACVAGGAGTGTGPNEWDIYGKFSYSWSLNGSSPEYRLKDWLDPSNTSPDSYAGMDQNCSSYPIVADFHVESTSVPFGTHVKFTNLTLRNPALPTSFLWEFEGVAQSSTSSITSPSRTFNQSSGTFPVTLTATNSEMSDSKTIYISVGTNGVASIDNSSIRIFPNPARDIVNIHLDGSVHAGSTIRMYNMIGEEIINSSNAQSDKIRLDVSDLKTGMYFIEISSDSGTFTKKLSLVK